MKKPEYEKCMEQVAIWSENNLAQSLQDQINIAQEAIKQTIIGHGHAKTYRRAIGMLYSLESDNDTLCNVLTWLERCWVYAVEYNPTIL
jgi:hypothetical protein